MRVRKWVAAIIMLAIVALFVPFVPQTVASGQFLGAQYHHTAVVSPSYYIFHCGSYVDSRYSTGLGSISGIYQASKGYTFSCAFNSS
jgi:hypothetical protein